MRQDPNALTPDVVLWLALLNASGYRPRTIVIYGGDLDRLAGWLAGQGVGHWRDLDRTHLRAYAADMYDAGLAVSSRRRSVTTIGRFLRHLAGRRMVDPVLATVMGKPRPERRLPRVPSAEAVAAIIEGVTGASALDQRDRALIEVLYATGGRATETVAARTTDYDPGRREIMLRETKEQADRIVLLGRPATVALDAYLLDGRMQLLGWPPLGFRPGRRVKRYTPKTSGHLWVARGGAPLTRRGVWRIVHGRALAVGEDVSPKALRHAFATHLMDGGADLRVIQTLLGHRRVTSTEIYTHVSLGGLRRTVDRILGGDDGREPRRDERDDPQSVGGAGTPDD